MDEQVRKVTELEIRWLVLGMFRPYFRPGHRNREDLLHGEAHRPDKTCHPVSHAASLTDAPRDRTNFPITPNTQRITPGDSDIVFRT